MAASQPPGIERPGLQATAADNLRQLIDQAELIVSNLRGAGVRALQLLELLDAMHGLLARLEGTGIDLRVEVARIQTVERLLQAKDSVLLRELRQAGGLAAAREAAKPATGQWWWYLDRRVAERRRRLLRRGLLAAGGVVAALFAAWALMTWVFPPDAKRVAVLDKTSKAAQLLEAGDLAGAADCYRQAVTIAPDDWELQVWVGVLEEQLGHAEAAAQAYAQAETIAPDRASYLVARGTAWLHVNALDKAQADGEAAVVANPESAEAHLLLGGAYEAQGDTKQAAAAFEKAGNLAEKAGNSALVVMARIRLGMLLQSAPMGPAQTAAPGS